MNEEHIPSTVNQHLSESSLHNSQPSILHQPNIVRNQVNEHPPNVIDSQIASPTSQILPPSQSTNNQFQQNVQPSIDKKKKDR